ncbi:10914_t:CDS:2 [Dentiscutata erythropus]|uniref:10914_t:CDS:1 n=1 Tax=Dentiscutata erythropus TaxID=1348616 RepID=A0A9N9F492_9GLOM|nr:10914_t:CDS:2 [Dentiscutata erythropus]
MNLVTKTTKCCCCIPLRGGVIIITLLSLIGTVLNIVSDILSIVNGGNNNNKTTSIISLIFGTLFFPIFVFGLFVLCCAKTARLLRIYSILYNIFTAIEIIGIIISIILFFVFKNSYVNDCININQSNGSSSNDPVGDCNHEFRVVGIVLVIIYIIVIILLIHFALVIAAYAANRRAKEDNASSGREVSESNVSSAHEISTPGVTGKKSEI